MPKKEPPFERLMRGFTINKKTKCWNWSGQTYKSGYGCIKAFGKLVSAHRLSYELFKGEIKDGLEILHSCDNKKCVNPDHLKTGTHAENMRAASQRGLMSSGDEHFMRINGSQTKGVKSPQSIQVAVLGNVYGSLKEAERELGLGSGTVAYWIKNLPNKAHKITKKEYENGK